jgi:DNA polymerase-1
MKWVLIDLSCLAYKAMYTVGDLAAEDIPTGVLYGFFEQLYALCESPSIKSNKVLIFTDSKKSYRRRTFPEYKQKRKQNKTPEELAQIKIMYEQIDKLKNKILPGLGIPVYKQVGLESDDLLAQASKYFTEKKEETIIITSDGDLYQCLTPYVNWYDPGRELFMDAKKLKETKGVNPKQWGLVKAMAGCTSDNVPGLPGVGEKTAVKYIMGELPDSHKTYETITSEEGQRDIKKWKGW